MALPLFPLPNFVLFPGQVTPLYVFELRYRELLAQVRRTGEPFGILRILSPSSDDPRPLPQRLARVGTLAHLRDVERHEDGTSSVTVVGGERFEVRRCLTDELYLRAEVDLWPLELGPAQSNVALAEQLLARLLQVRPADTERLQQLAPPDPLLLASFAAVLLPISSKQRQAALEAPDLTQRLQHLLASVPRPQRQLN